MLQIGNVFENNRFGLVNLQRISEFVTIYGKFFHKKFLKNMYFPSIYIYFKTNFIFFTELSL